MFWQARVQPNFDRAMDSYKDALGQLQQLQERFDKSGSIADGWRWSRSLALLQRDIGDFLLSKRSKIKEADESFQQSSETFRKLKQLRPVDVEIDFNLAWAANKSGDMLYQQGQFDAALDQFEIARDGITALGERYLWANLEWRGLLSVVYGNVGLSLREQMKFQKAIEAFDECAKQVGKLVELDPQRAFWREVLAWAHDVMGETKIQWAQTEHEISRGRQRSTRPWTMRGRRK
jgi:tetratricopeptide (TPR) repeat protein